MLVVLQTLVTLSAGLFAGAALYISLVEHPVRTILETQAAATQWAPSYKRATWLQAPLAIVGLLTGALACFLGGGVGWLVGAILIGTVVPVTFLIIMPTNHKLLDPNRDLSSVETRSLLNQWGRLHVLRTANSVYPTPCTTVPSIRSGAASDKRYSLGLSQTPPRRSVVHLPCDSHRLL